MHFLFKQVTSLSLSLSQAAHNSFFLLGKWWRNEICAAIYGYINKRFFKKPCEPPCVSSATDLFYLLYRCTSRYMKQVSKIYQFFYRIKKAIKLYFNLFVIVIYTYIWTYTYTHIHIHICESYYYKKIYYYILYNLFITYTHICTYIYVYT